MTDRRLRLQHLLIQPILIWDDGEEIEPGPPVHPVTLTLSHITPFLEQLPAEIQRLALEHGTPATTGTGPATGD